MKFAHPYKHRRRSIANGAKMLRYYIHVPLYVFRSPTMRVGGRPLTEVSTRNLPGSKGRPVNKTDNVTAICEPIV
jgi:hypothetical protein